VGLLAGTNHDEQSFETCVPYGSITIAQYNATLEKVFYNPLYLSVATVRGGREGGRDRERAVKR
jgi:hypothetical protein